MLDGSPFTEERAIDSGLPGGTPYDERVDDNGITRYTIKLAPGTYTLKGNWSGYDEYFGNQNKGRKAGWPGKLTIKDLNGEELLEPWRVPPGVKEDETTFTV